MAANHMLVGAVVRYLEKMEEEFFYLNSLPDDEMKKVRLDLLVGQFLVVEQVIAKYKSAELDKQFLSFFTNSEEERQQHLASVEATYSDLSKRLKQLEGCVKT